MNADLSVLMVGPLPPPSGGMANQTRQLACLLTAEGVRVRVVQTNAPYAPAWVGSVRGLRAMFRLIPYLWRLWREVPRVQLIHVMANSGWAWHLIATPAIRIASWRRIPVIVNYRGGLAREFLARSQRRVLPLVRRASLVVVPSGFLREVFGEYGVLTRVIPNIVDLDMFRAGVASGSPQSRPHIVIARNLEQIYGIDTALRAIKLIVAMFPGLRVSIAGTGPERAVLERLAVELRIEDRVRFTGRLEVEAMAELYRTADLVLNPSRVDNMPNSVLEALACRVPVVSTDVGGIPYLLEQGRTAWLTKPDFPEAMSAAMLHVLTDSLLRERLRAEGYKLALSCGWSNVRDQWLDAYQTAARSRGDGQ